MMRIFSPRWGTPTRAVILWEDVPLQSKSGEQYLPTGCLNTTLTVLHELLDLVRDKFGSGASAGVGRKEGYRGGMGGSRGGETLREQDASRYRWPGSRRVGETRQTPTCKFQGRSRV